MDILGSLGTIINNVKNVTLPGVLAALGFALFIWPPHTYDRIPSITDHHPDIARLQLLPEVFANDRQSFNDYLALSQPACTVREGAESAHFLTIPLGFQHRSSVAVENQLALDDIERSLAKCSEEEQSLQGIEDLAIKNLGLLITTRTAERDGINAQYQKYILALSPMKEQFKCKLEDKENEIAELQAHALNLQRAQNERTRRSAQLQRLDKEMLLRLGDAGRLRPTQKFDDVLSGLSSHIVGFLTLVLAWGLLVDPINRAVFSYLYDSSFGESWDDFRVTRETPGQDAHDKWFGANDRTGKKSGSGSAAPSGSSNYSAAITITLLVIVVVVFAVACSWVKSPALPTASQVCATTPDSQGHFILRAEVVAPGAGEVPKGKIGLFSSNEKLKGESIDLDSEGKACVKACVKDLGLSENSSFQVKYYGTGERSENALDLGKYGLAACAPSSNSSPPAESAIEHDRTPVKFLASASQPVVLPTVQKAAKEPPQAACLAGKPKTQRPPEPQCKPEPELKESQLAEIEQCSPVVPELRYRPISSFGFTLVLCVVMSLLGCLAAYLVPRLLRPAQAPAQEADVEEREAFLSAVHNGSSQVAVRDRQWALQFVQEVETQTIQEGNPSHDRSELEASVKMFQARLAAKLARRNKESPETNNAEAKELVEKIRQNIQPQDRHDATAAQGHEAAGATKLTDQQLQELVDHLSEKIATKKSLTCEQKLARDWNKLSQPQYAIGQGLMTRADYEKLQSDYYDQSLVSTGLMAPLFLLVLALLLTPQFGLNNPSLYLALGAGEALLLITGVDRRHKFNTELDSTISSTFLKNCQTKKDTKSAADTSSDSIAKQIEAALEAARIMQTTDLVIVKGSEPAPGKPSTGKKTTLKETDKTVVPARASESAAPNSPPTASPSSGETTAEQTDSGNSTKTGDKS